MKNFWRQLGNHVCLQYWPEEIQQWARLYTAIGLDRHEQTIMLAQTIIENSIAAPTPQLNFLVGATLTADMKTGRYQRIEDAHGRIQFPLYLKILFAQLDIAG